MLPSGRRERETEGKKRRTSNTLISCLLTNQKIGDKTLADAQGGVFRGLEVEGAGSNITITVSPP